MAKKARGGRESQHSRPLRSGIKSLETALLVLGKLASRHRAMSLSELATLAGMPPSKVHRYLASFINVGLVSQRHRSGQYDLGKGAVELGLAAMGRIDVINLAAERLEDIAAQTKAAALIAVWGTQGPTIVRWQRIPTMIVSSLGLGATLPLLSSASGRIFLAYAEQSLTAQLLAKEIKEIRAGHLPRHDFGTDWSSVKKLREKIRRDGYATDKFIISGHYSASVPLLNWQNEIEGALTLVNVDPELIRPSAPALQYLLRVSRDLSMAVSRVSPPANRNRP